MDFDEAEIQLAIAASLGQDVDALSRALQSARSNPPGPSNGGVVSIPIAMTSRQFMGKPDGRDGMTMEEQLAERRHNLGKRKADEESLMRNFESGKRMATLTSVKQVRMDDVGSLDEGALDMQLDGMDLEEQMKQLVMKNPSMRKKLMMQMKDIDVDMDTKEEAVAEESDMQNEGDEAFGSMDLETFHPLRPSLGFSFPKGALRMTRTPGRDSTPNCISVEELLDKKNLQCACIFAFYIGDEDFFRYLPMEEGSTVPLYVGRDINLDPFHVKALEAHKLAKGKGKVTQKNLATIRPTMQSIYAQLYGLNFKAFYPHCPGCAHSKIMLLIYPTFLRLVITSCNLMNVDTVLGDNHWYIHDLPRFASNKALPVNTAFEKLFTVHLQQLGVPKSFFTEHFSGRFDFSAVKVHLVTSRPGVAAGLLAESSGLLRLRKVISSLDDVRSEMLKNGVKLEYCAGSVGRLYDKWMKEFYDCAIGKSRLKLAEYDCDVPPVDVVFPTFEDVEACDDLVQKIASKNIGAYLSWGNAREEIKARFHHYLSKDTGKLFHMKLLLALDPKDATALPYYVYAGSANFSKGAWGKLEKVKDGDKSDATRGTKLEDTVNFECGVVIPRNVLLDLLEPGSDWQDIVPYHRPLLPYDLESDASRPFAQGPKEDKSEMSGKD